MFQYSDPSGTDLLSRFRAISEWRAEMERQYSTSASQAGSGFTWIDALLDIDEGKRADATISWKAFPILAQASHEQIDADRRLQEEYVEWAVFRDAAGNIDEIVFTTEFREYFGILAGVSPTGIQTAIRDLNPGAAPTIEEIYGVANVNGLPMRQRKFLFERNLFDNPWNNGERGILALTFQVNSIPALFGLAAFCGIEKDGLPADQVCANVGGACVPGRQSDPRVCTACQQQIRQERSFSLIDPAGIFIERMAGIWTVGNQQIDINDGTNGRWTLSRNARRGVLKVSGGDELQVDGDPIETGAQVADKLFVAATVTTAADADLPEWARAGKEDLQRPQRV